MTKFFLSKGKYLVFLCCYLSLLSFVGLSLTFSRYHTRDSDTDSAAAAKYNVYVYSGEDTDHIVPIDVHICATSKITEPDSMTGYSETYSIDKVTIVNNSECCVLISDFSFEDTPSSEYYSKLVMFTDDDAPPSIEDVQTRFNTFMDGYLQEHNNTEPDEAVKAVIDDMNENRTEKTLFPDQSASLYVITWAEHSDIYGTQNEHYNQTIGQIGVTSEHFVLKLRSEQTD